MATFLGFKPIFIPSHKEQRTNEWADRKERKEKKKKMSDFDTMHLLGGRGSALIP